MECATVFVPIACFIAIFIFVPMYRAIITMRDELKTYREKERADEIKKTIFEEVKAHIEHARQKERSYE